MNQKNEVIEAVDTAIKKGEDFVEKSKDFILCLEILLTAAEGIQSILKKYDGGEIHE